MEPDGLAGTTIPAGTPGAAGAGGASAEEQALIAEIVQLLREGVDPQMLIDEGIPPELVEAAIEVLLAEEPAAAPAPAPATNTGAEMRRPV